MVLPGTPGNCQSLSPIMISSVFFLVAWEVWEPPGAAVRFGKSPDLVSHNDLLLSFVVPLEAWEPGIPGKELVSPRLPS